MWFGKSKKDTPEHKVGLFARMKQALGATKNNFVTRIEAVLSSKASIDESLLEELEGILLGADLGVRATTRIMDEIRQQRKRGELQSPDDVRSSIRKQLLAILDVRERPGNQVSADIPAMTPRCRRWRG